MGNQYTGSDKVRCFLSGAVAAGDPQNDAFMSLGNARSSFLVESLSLIIIDAMPNINILHCSYPNSEGTGSLYAKTSSTLTWTPPGDTVGSEVTILNGETKIIEGLDTTKFIVVERTDANALSGTTSVQMRTKPDNLFGESTVLGSVDYRCVIFKNLSGETIPSFYVWCDESSIDLGIDNNQNVDNTGRSEKHAPEGVSFQHYDGTYSVNNSFDNISITNNTFNTNLSDWTVSSGWQWYDNSGNGVALIGDTGGGTETGTLYRSLPITSGRIYRLSYDATVGLGTVVPYLGGTYGIPITISGSQIIICGNLNTNIAFYATDAAGGIDNVVLEELNAMVVDSRLPVDSMLDNEETFLWIRRTLSSPTVSLNETNQVDWGVGNYGYSYGYSYGYGYGFGGMDYFNAIGFTYRVADDSIDSYAFYRGINEEPDFVTPYETFTTVPHETPVQTPSNVYYFVLRARNRFNVESQNIASYRLDLDAGGNVNYTKPSAPENIIVTAGPDGKINIKAIYNSSKDLESIRAEYFIVYASTSAIDVDNDTPVEVSLGDDNIKYLDYQTTGFTDGLTVNVLVRMRRKEVSDTVNVDSSNTTEYTAVANTDGPAAPILGTKIYTGEATIVWQHNEDNYIQLFYQPGVYRFVLGGMVVCGIGSSRAIGIRSLIETPLGTSQAQDIEWNATNSSICFAQGGTRKMEVFPNGDIQVSALIEDISYPIVSEAFTPIEQHTGELSFSTDLIKTVASLLADGTLKIRELREDI